MSKSSAAASPVTPLPNPQMPPTLWTLILNARDLNSPGSQSALAELCEIYWYPLYAFVRRQGNSHHQAQDLTQGFFEHLFVQPHWLRGVDQNKGRFRTFLLCALSNFLINEHSRERAIKRGGGAERFVSWDPEAGDSRVKHEPALETNPGMEYDRLWACALVEKAAIVLRTEYERCGKLGLYHALSPFLTCPIPAGQYAEIATRLQTSEGALRIAMHRLVQRFGQLLREQVAQTVADPAAVDDELRDVLKAWAASPNL